ncbi:uncharacterized protein LOC111867035 [Cryptotermes secundus]|uniref:uncharacterized protein LOC111867035 n=1 Tax=Cryptotermes secundus TaxID=105785 RepID=UPI000CD7B112|nr:uncharacterized protein LOC111867035 [Cryptotermes secundus]
MNARLVIIALCAFQFVAADSNTDQAKSGLQDIASQIQSWVESFRDRAERAISEALATAQNFIQSLQDRFKDAQDKLVSAYSNDTSASQVKTCAQNGQQQASAVINSTKDEIQAKAASSSEDAKAYADQASSLAKQASGSVGQVALNFTTCLVKNPLTGFIKCPLEVAAAARDLATAYTSAFSNILTSGESIISQFVSNLGASFESNLQSASAQIQSISEDVQKCVQEVAAAANKTAETSSQ